MDEDFENDAIEYDISYPHPQNYANLKYSLRKSPFSQSLANQSTQDFNDDDDDDEEDDNENSQKSYAMKTQDELEWLPIRKKLKSLMSTFKFSTPKHPIKNSPYSHSFINEGNNGDEDEEDEEWLERRNDCDDNNNQNENTFNDDDNDYNDYKQKSHAMKTEDELDWHSEKNKMKSVISTYEFAAQEPTQSTAAPSPSKPSVGVRSSFIDHWTDEETLILLDVWGNQFILNERKSLRFEEWKQVAEKVSEVSNFEMTVTQCRNRVDTLKKKYKKDKIKFEETGFVDGKCVYFKKMDKLMSTVSTPLQQAGLSCDLDSGLCVPLKPRDYVSHANQLGDMKNSPGNIESIGTKGLEGSRGLDSRLCVPLKPRVYVNRANQFDDMKSSPQNTEAICAEGLEGPRGLDSRLCVPLKLSDYVVNRANQLEDMKNSPRNTESIGAKGLEVPRDLDSRLCASLKPRDYVNRANRLDDMKNSPQNSDSIGTKGLEGPREKKISKVKGCTDEPSSFKLLADSIQKLGIIYEQMENKKWQQVVELEKLRMDFLNDMETQRRQNFQRLINEILKLVQMDDKNEDSAKNDDKNLEGLQSEILKLEQRDDKNDDSAKSGM